jgi:hypothetical protein
MQPAVITGLHNFHPEPHSNVGAIYFFKEKPHQTATLHERPKGDFLNTN